jgi:hypothetical protein
MHRKPGEVSPQFTLYGIRAFRRCMYRVVSGHFKPVRSNLYGDPPVYHNTGMAVIDQVKRSMLLKTLYP